MTLDDAIQTLQAAREVLGGEALLGVSVPGKDGFTSPYLQFVGPVRMELKPDKRAIVLVAYDPRSSTPSLANIEFRPSAIFDRSKK